MKTYEHIIEPVPHSNDAKGLGIQEAIVKDRGADGWELVAVQSADKPEVGHVRLYFKRELAERAETSDQKQHPSFEHAIVPTRHATGHQGLQEQQEIVAKRGEEGWELIAVQSVDKVELGLARLYFKRPKQ